MSILICKRNSLVWCCDMLISAIDIIIPIYVWLSFPWYLLTENLYIAINRGKSR